MNKYAERANICLLSYAHYPYRQIYERLMQIIYTGKKYILIKTNFPHARFQKTNGVFVHI